jgi:heme-degrading monooxygenase HmoA
MKSRKKAVDTMPGFQRMEVLKPRNSEHDYLIISHWDSENFFQQWRSSSEFSQGHRRGVQDISKARKEGKKPPMTSTFKTYETLTE